VHYLIASERTELAPHTPAPPGAGQVSGYTDTTKPTISVISVHSLMKLPGHDATLSSQRTLDNARRDDRAAARNPFYGLVDRWATARSAARLGGEFPVTAACVLMAAVAAGCRPFADRKHAADQLADAMRAVGLRRVRR
jgi:hypothetical protein